jgi:hypothetical protein
MSQLPNLAIFSNRKVDKSKYFQKMMADDDIAIKKNQRRLVNLFIMRHLSPIPFSYQHKCLTLPGGAWAFERSFVSGEKMPYFVGVEREQVVFERSIFYLPGRTRYSGNIPFAYPTGEVQIVHSEEAMSLHCSLSTLLTAVPAHKSLARRYKHIHSAWLDFSSAMCDEISDSLEFLPNVLAEDVPVVPVAISVMGCRETEKYSVKGARSRASALLGLLSKNPRVKYEVADVFSYISGTSTRMETLLVLARK